jgi:hypothetical protein
MFSPSRNRGDSNLDDAEALPVVDHSSSTALRMLRGVAPPTFSGRGRLDASSEGDGEGGRSTRGRARDYQSMGVASSTHIHRPLPSIAENRTKKRGGVFSQLVDMFSANSGGEEQPSLGIAYSADEKTRYDSLL